MHAGGRRLPIDPQAAVDSLYNMSTHIHGFTNAVHESLKGYSYNTYNASSAQVKVKSTVVVRTAPTLGLRTAVQ